MKKLFAVFTILAFTVSCQKTNNGSDNEEIMSQDQKNFTLNNVRIDASTIRNWIADRNLDRVVLTFHSADLRSIGSNLTLAAFVYDNNSQNPVEPGIVLDIATPATLALEANVIFSNNTIRMGAIRRAVFDASGMLDFDYLLLQPHYYREAGKSYLVYLMQAIKNGAPVKMRVEGDECDFSNPSPPADPSLEECEPEP